MEGNIPTFSLLICKVVDIDSLPTINVNIQGKEFKIEKEYYLQNCHKNPSEGEDGPLYCETYI